MLKFLKSLPAVEVAGAFNLVVGATLNMLSLWSGDSWGMVGGSLMILNGVILTNLK